MTPPSPRLVLATIGLSLFWNSPVFARTYVVPHFIQSNVQSVTPFSFATNLQLTYVPGLVDLEPATGATVDVYLFNSAGAIAQSGTAQPVCNPCSFVLNAGVRRTNVSLYSRFISAGGFANTTEIGFILINVSGDADNVALGSQIANSHTSVLDMSVAVQKVVEVPGGLSSTGRLIVYPHIVEDDEPTSTPNSFDTNIIAAYAGGITGSPIPAGGGAAVALYLFENNGTPMKSALATNVCAPCIETVSAGDPRAIFNLQSKFDAVGGAGGPKVGFGLAVITGNADAVVLGGYLGNSHTSSFDLNLAELESVELPYSPPPTSVTPPGAGSWLRSFPNPVSPFTRLEYSVDRAGPVSVEIIDVRGRVVARPVVNRQHAAGSYNVEWKGNDDAGKSLPSGVYFARLVSPEATRVVKMTVLR